MPSALTLESRVHGCLFGGAIGDAISAHETSASGRRDVTNATLMMLFVGEGVIRAYVRQSQRGICSPPAVIQHALVRWAALQGATLRFTGKGDASRWPDGWLAKRAEMRVKRRGGDETLAALEKLTSLGDPIDVDEREELVRVAPIGLAMESLERAGPFARILASVVAGRERPREAITHPSLEAAIASADGASSFEEAVDLTDATAACLAGQLRGAMHGMEGIPPALRASVELGDILTRIASDLARVRQGSFDARAASTDYPGW